MPLQENLVEITVWYRGVVEGRLARQITNLLADAAQEEGKYVQAFDNYTDLPDRVYVPCRSYARICPEPIAEPYVYVNGNPAVVICTDPALVKGCHVLKGMEPGGSLIVNTGRDPEFVLSLLKDLPELERLRKVATLDAGCAHQLRTPQGGIEGASEKAAAMRAAAMLAGAAAKVSGIVSLESLVRRVQDKESVHAGYESVREVANPEFNPAARGEDEVEFGYREKVDLIVPAPRPNGRNDGHISGNYRIFRPVVNQEKCTGCRICWISCPDACITVMDASADGERIRVDLDYCKGCGICWEVCPVGCIEAREEVDFPDGVIRITYTI